MKKIGILILAIGLVLGFSGCKTEVDNVELTGITVTPPSKITYEIGEALNTDGLKVTAVYSDESTKDVTEKASVGVLDSSTAGEKTVSVSYTEDEITVNSSFKVTVNEKPAEEPPAEEPPAEPETPPTPPTPVAPAKGDKVTGKTYMDAEGNIKIGETSIPKTSEVIVIPSGTTAEIAMEDDSSWSTYCDNTAPEYFKGVFIKNRKVKLSPFVMSQFQVTEQLWAQVMGETATTSIKPKASINWYQAITFCNKLTLLTGGTVEDLVYEVSGVDFTSESISIPTSNDDTWNKAVCHIDRKGYRLPTEAEWEFAARGGDPNAKAWKYAFSGIDCDEYVINKEKKNAEHYDSDGWITEDENLKKVAVYSKSGNSKAEVGTKTANALNLYDMSGNVLEWCWDWYNSSASSNDSAYTVDGYVQNPLGASASGSSYRCYRGGGFSDNAYGCCVSCRLNNCPYGSSSYLGFRVCRSSSEN